ncbi:MAG: hypothetical protein Q4A82_07305 [Corynebacterium sp.]|nr:hypothetical protein [Corynebacterium sp.]
MNMPVSEWSQDQVDAVFYSMVSDLTGAPKELIDPGTVEIVGYSKQTLFGQRKWYGGGFFTVVVCWSI